MLFGSPHQVDSSFLVANTASLIIFPLTAYLLRKSYSNSKDLGFTIQLTILLLVATCGIFTYYTFDFAWNTEEGTSSIIWLPIIVSILAIVFIVNLVTKLRKIHGNTA